MSQHVVIFVPGAWHSPDGFDEVIQLLAAKGFASRKVYLPSVGRSPPISSFGPDVEAIRSTALAEIQQGHDITVVCHSYGGLPTSQALKGLDKPQSDGGGRVSAIVYIAAFLFPEGDTVVTSLTAHGGGGTGPYTELLDDGNISFKKGTNPAEVFYNDLSPEEGRNWASKLKSQASASFYSSADYAAWMDIPSWYLVALQDKALSPETQRVLIREGRELLDKVGGPGTGEQRLKSEEIDTGHSPFLSRPEDTAAFVERAAMAYLK